MDNEENKEKKVNKSKNYFFDLWYNKVGKQTITNNEENKYVPEKWDYKI
jgi:hypothetical protein